MATLDPHKYALQRLSTLRTEFAWKRGDGEAWSRALRKRLCEAVGLPVDREVPLEVELIERRTFDGYERETLHFTGQPGMRVFAYLLIPHGIASRGPAVFCVPGHGPGVDILVGEAPQDYQNQFALQSVRSGFVTLAIEQISFGHRMSAGTTDKGSSCVRDSMAALMFGSTMIGWRCFDASRGYDLLASRPEVDPNRIAIMSISGGGLTAFWAACLDERFAASVVSGYFNTFFDSILSIEHCVDNFAPGLANIVEMPDLAALIAPRKLFVESGTEDPIFPSQAFEKACRTAEAIYADLGESEAFASDHFPGDHVFYGKHSIPKLVEWLQASSQSTSSA